MFHIALIFMFLFYINCFSVKHVNQLEGKYYLNNQKLCIHRGLIFKESQGVETVLGRVNEKISDSIGCDAFVFPVNIGSVYSVFYIEKEFFYIFKTVDSELFNALLNHKSSFKYQLVEFDNNIVEKSIFYHNAVICLLNFGKTPNEVEFLIKKRINQEPIEKISSKLLGSIRER